MYKKKGSNNKYQTPFDLMANEDILKPDGSFEEFKDGNSNIGFYDFVKAGTEILCKDCALSVEQSETDNRNYARNASSGDSARNASSGNYARNASSGTSAQNEITGKNSVCFDCGFRGIIKAVKGTWIALQDYKKDGDRYVPSYAKVAQIGNPDYTDVHGEVLGEKYSYTLVGKDFWKCAYIDGDLMLYTQEKELGEYTIHKAYYGRDYRENGAGAKKIFIASNSEFNAHGETVKKAIADLQFKVAQSKDVSEHVERIKRENKVSPFDYRLITGACEAGTQRFLNEKGKVWEDTATIDEVIELTRGYWGHETFVRLLRG